MSTTISFLPFPESGVCVGTPDGDYYKRFGNNAQVIVVGLMKATPFGYVDAVLASDPKIGEVNIIDANFIKADPPLNRISLERGFFSIEMEIKERILE